ncbi:MAG TPA: dihydroorotase [Casimicrobiaceae bacterium]|nr:dihydroorotase [Casimicrobiaceae bacterium]
MTLTITRPDDGHLHLRDGEMMRSVVGATARTFARAVVMPNLMPPVTTVAAAAAYRDRILAALPAGSTFAPLMTLYLTDNTPAEEIVRARASGFVIGAKYYPAGATTHSDSGVTDLSQVYAALAAMEKHGLPLLVHGEVTDPDIDIFDRERVFIDRQLSRIVRDFPTLKIVLEHITTTEAAQFIDAAGPHIGATITPQHLLWSRNALLAGGMRPHFYCMPVLKREAHRLSLVRVATGGSPKYFLGTDSAPHARNAKESACGCPGCYSAHAAIELYAEAFDGADALERLEAFASFHGADFYGLPRNTATITLKREAWVVPATYPFGEHTVVPLRAGETMRWRLDATSSTRS